MTELEKRQTEEIKELKKLLIQNGILEENKSKAFSSVKSSYFPCSTSPEVETRNKSELLPLFFCQIIAI